MTTRDAGGWVRTNLLPLAILAFQLVQFGLGNSFELKAQASELGALKARILEVEDGCEKKETLALKLEAVRAEIARLREQLEKRDQDTRRAPRER